MFAPRGSNQTGKSNPAGKSPSLAICSNSLGNYHEDSAGFRHNRQ